MLSYIRYLQSQVVNTTVGDTSSRIIDLFASPQRERILRPLAQEILEFSPQKESLLTNQLASLKNIDSILDGLLILQLYNDDVLTSLDIMLIQFVVSQSSFMRSTIFLPKIDYIIRHSSKQKSESFQMRKTIDKLITQCY
ncbi:hypothetical protein [Levilactobacillus fujinensis]|uniref:Uncharacterized protein n=1 Tax=Levilactobacillus fujinensis TaxID=2486024 RepID=A0ABW1TFF5_9LACO|nr:hypothetical protein [Levilactobacillus fujinensis]